MNVWLKKWRENKSNIKKIIKLGQNFGIIKGGRLTKIHSHNRTIEVFVMKYNILNHEKWNYKLKNFG